MQIQRKDHTA